MEKIFSSMEGYNLAIRNSRKTILLELKNYIINKDKKRFLFELHFEEKVFKELEKYLYDIAKETWEDFIPKEADCMRADYTEYYSRKYDNNGYLYLRENSLKIDRPSVEDMTLYKFNKRRMESFIYDIINKNVYQY